ncbi:hypothetical protein [Helicobacter turcicus]|uniref:Glycosyltransferase n=1 Tax=Helicobacter turcicus TaxID=2867412 RepID=A0ABS7JP04_9HELI|nr:hypothetical protein [Helicobacter turcicus]MBX7491102.1 hypothetical protein [Helicobacter turcicus]
MKTNAISSFSFDEAVHLWLCENAPTELFTPMWSRAFKKELFLKNYENNLKNLSGLIYAEDVLHNLTYCSYVKTIKYIPMPLYYYSHNESSTTHNKEKNSRNIADLQKVMEYLENFFAKDSFNALIAKIENCNLKIDQIDRYKHLCPPFKLVLKLQRKFTKIKKKALIKKALKGGVNSGI